MVHVADCPCHGSQYHNNVNDNYQAGDPAGISHEDMMKKVVENNIQYWFGYINSSMTDKMIQVFNESLQRLSQRRLLICQVQATDPQGMGDAVNKYVVYNVSAMYMLYDCHNIMGHCQLLLSFSIMLVVLINT